MGRAAHNLNQLIAVQQETMRQKIVLVACCGEKLSHPAPAKNLYQSDLFRKSRAWAEQHGDTWLILSAKYGVVHPESIIDAYDETLNDKNAEERRSWSQLIIKQLDNYRNEQLIVLAGNRYCEWIDTYPHVERPMQGLGIGQQLAWLNGAIQSQLSLFSSTKNG